MSIDAADASRSLAHGHTKATGEISLAGCPQSLFGRTCTENTKYRSTKPRTNFPLALHLYLKPDRGCVLSLSLCLSLSPSVVFPNARLLISLSLSPPPPLVVRCPPTSPSHLVKFVPSRIATSPARSR